MIIASLILFVPACEKQQPASSPPPPETNTLQLDELSTAQRRVFLKGFPGDWREDTDMARGVAEPPTRLPVPDGAQTITLADPKTLALGTLPVSEAIVRRRSHREFTSDPLNLDQISYLLACTQGVTATVTDDSGKVTQRFRAAPSGGGRYPLETFLAVRHIAGLKPGIYRYLPEDHQLLVVSEDPETGDKLGQACYGDTTTSSAPVVFIWAAVAIRSEWKYGCIAHKMVAMEAGHVCQNLYLAAESIDAGACALLGYHQPALDALIGADGEELFTIYLAAVGMVLHP